VLQRQKRRVTQRGIIYNSPKKGKKIINCRSLKNATFLDFRTKKEREFTGIGGSSMGGLISVFCGLIFPNIYDILNIYNN
jgi:hypothetical protein